MPRTELPMVIRSVADMGPARVAMTVASVGPYALNTFRVDAHSATNAASHASPPTITVPRSGTSAGSIVARAAGVTNA